VEASGLGARPATLLLGLGNPILCDDGVGLIVARELHARLPEGACALEEAALGGFELLPLLQGWRRVVIVDAAEGLGLAPGEVVELELDARGGGPTPVTPHHAGLPHALELGRTLGLELPEEIRVFAIGVREARRFSERCTEEVARAIPTIVELIRQRAFSDG
jgi:hydrogenase maturation protease